MRFPSQPERLNGSMTVRIDQLDEAEDEARQDYSEVAAIVLENEPGKLNKQL
jgi:hypothetical protein